MMIVLVDRRMCVFLAHLLIVMSHDFLCLFGILQPPLIIECSTLLLVFPVGITKRLFHAFIASSAPTFIIGTGVAHSMTLGGLSVRIHVFVIARALLYELLSSILNDDWRMFEN